MIDSASSTQNINTFGQPSPRRRLTSSDSSHRIASNGGRSNRLRRYNVDFGMDTNSFLPPSTSSSLMNDVNRVQTDFNAIASSISNLATSHVIRHTDVIDDKIIQTIQDRILAERNGASEELIQAYKNKLDSLNRERNLSVMYMERYYETVTELNHHRDDNANEDEGE